MPAPASSLLQRLGCGLTLLGAGVLGLAVTNPGPEAFEEFAGEQLSRVLVQEVCEPEGLPMMLRLVIRDCPELIRSQRRTLGHLAGTQTRRRNLGLASVYRTDLGGQALMGNWKVPHYRTVTLAAAGQFVMVRTDALRRDGP